MEPGSACPHPCGWPPSCAGGQILNPCGSRSKGRLPHRGGASDSETDRVVRLTAPQGGSDEDQNGFLEAEFLDSLNAIERMRAAGGMLYIIRSAGAAWTPSRSATGSRDRANRRRGTMLAMNLGASAEVGGAVPRQLSGQSVGRLQDYRQLAYLPGGQENARSC